MLVQLLSCRERFRLKYVLGLDTADKWSKTFGYGNMWHVCEEAFAMAGEIGESPEAAANRWTARLTVHMMDQVSKHRAQEEEIRKWYRVCCVQFPEYVKYWVEHPDVKNRTPLMQEQVFDVPYQLPSGRVVRLRGKFDSVDLITDEVTGPDGGIYLQENKTKGDIDQSQIERQLKFDLQTMLYLVALIEERDTHQWGAGVPVRGVRYNVIRRPLSGGKGSIKPHGAKATKTKFTPAETAEEFYERLRRDYIADDPAYWFFRVRAEVSARDIQVFRETCLDPLLEQLCWWYEEITGNRPANHKWLNLPLMNYRTPFGVYSALEEGGATEYDAYLESGSEVGLRRVETLFTELQ